MNDSDIFFEVIKQANNNGVSGKIASVTLTKTGQELYILTESQLQMILGEYKTITKL